MGRSRYQIYDSEYPYFITSSIMNGLPLFSLTSLSDIIIKGLRFLQENRDVTLFAYVIMENHIHAIVQGERLSGKIGSFKSFTARNIVDKLKKEGHSNWLRQLRISRGPYKSEQNYRVWEYGYHPKQITGDTMLWQKIEYIHNNPVKRGYIDRPEHWRYSSARNYAGSEGILDITRI